MSTPGDLCAPAGRQQGRSAELLDQSRALEPHARGQLAPVDHGSPCGAVELDSPLADDRVRGEPAAARPAPELERPPQPVDSRLGPIDLSLASADAAAAPRADAAAVPAPRPLVQEIVPRPMPQAPGPRIMPDGRIAMA